MLSNDDKNVLTKRREAVKTYKVFFQFIFYLLTVNERVNTIHS